MIRVEDLRRSFGEVKAVDGVTFDARDGEVTGLLGPNGAGKTTSLRMMYGLLEPDSGRIQVDNVDLLKDRMAGQARMGVLPDLSGLYPRLTAREHIRYFANLRGMKGPELEQRIESWLDALDMRPLADRRVSGFSHGERTKVAMARALIHGPQNVILDEPTNGLDVMSTRSVRDVIRRLKTEGRCVLFSSHIMQEVSALCDRIVVIARGRVVADGTPDQIREHSGKQDLEDAFVWLVDKEAQRA